MRSTNNVTTSNEKPRVEPVPFSYTPLGAMNRSLHQDQRPTQLTGSAYPQVQLIRSTVPHKEALLAPPTSPVSPNLKKPAFKYHPSSSKKENISLQSSQVQPSIIASAFPSITPLHPPLHPPPPLTSNKISDPNILSFASDFQKNTNCNNGSYFSDEEDTEDVSLFDLEITSLSQKRQHKKSLEKQEISLISSPPSDPSQTTFNLASPLPYCAPVSDHSKQSPPPPPPHSEPDEALQKQLSHLLKELSERKGEVEVLRGRLEIKEKESFSSQQKLIDLEMRLRNQTSQENQQLLVENQQLKTQLTFTNHELQESGSKMQLQMSLHQRQLQDLQREHSKLQESYRKHQLLLQTLQQKKALLSPPSDATDPCASPFLESQRENPINENSASSVSTASSASLPTSIPFRPNITSPPSGVNHSFVLTNDYQNFLFWKQKISSNV